MRHRSRRGKPLTDLQFPLFDDGFFTPKNAFCTPRDCGTTAVSSNRTGLPVELQPTSCFYPRRWLGITRRRYPRIPVHTAEPVLPAWVFSFRPRCSVASNGHVSAANGASMSVDLALSLSALPRADKAPRFASARSACGAARLACSLPPTPR